MPFCLLEAHSGIGNSLLPAFLCAISETENENVWPVKTEVKAMYLINLFKRITLLNCFFQDILSQCSQSWSISEISDPSHHSKGRTWHYGVIRLLICLEFPFCANYCLAIPILLHLQTRFKSENPVTSTFKEYNVRLRPVEITKLQTLSAPQGSASTALEKHAYSTSKYGRYTKVQIKLPIAFLLATN